MGLGSSPLLAHDATSTLRRGSSALACAGRESVGRDRDRLAVLCQLPAFLIKHELPESSRQRASLQISCSSPATSAIADATLKATCCAAQLIPEPNGRPKEVRCATHHSRFYNRTPRRDRACRRGEAAARALLHACGAASQRGRATRMVRRTAAHTRMCAFHRP